MAENTEILTIKEPVIELKPIEVEDQNPSGDSIPKQDKILGSATPVIRINTYNISSDFIIKFKISSIGFVPNIELVFTDTTNQFQGDFPKDGDLLEVYIRSRNNDKFKKIRIDFDIIKINGKVDAEGINIYSISGIMRVPDLFSEQQISLSSDTSYNHLLKICDLISLGFASNDTKTNDKMPRFNPNNTIKDFIKNTIDTSYKDEDSFFTSYIDLYYYLCFVNVNSLFSINEDLEDGTIDALTAAMQDKGQDGKEGNDTKILFSNHPKFEETTNYIKSYALFNNSGDIWMNNGYKRYSQYMDMDNFEFQSFFIDPFTTEGAESNSVLLKGRQGDTSYEKQNKYIYLGRMYSTENEGNLHPNYHYSKILNYQNNEELNKMGLTIELADISSNIYRYKRIPIAIFRNKNGVLSNISMQEGDKQRGTSATQGDDVYSKDDSYIQDNFLTGFYIVRDYSINWTRDGFTQTVNLIRREWPIPNSAGTIKNIK